MVEKFMAGGLHLVMMRAATSPDLLPLAKKTPEKFRSELSGVKVMIGEKLNRSLFLSLRRLQLP